MPCTKPPHGWYCTGWSFIIFLLSFYLVSCIVSACLGYGYGKHVQMYHTLKNEMILTE